MRAPDTDLPIVLSGITVKAGAVTILDGVTQTIAAGAPTVLIGPNGAGKTTLLRVVMGLAKPDAGSIVWGNRDDAAKVRRAIVFQRPVMLRRTAWENVDYALRLRRIAAAERRALVEDALRKTKLHRHARRPARTLSFGEQQRLALARAWALRPDVLFLDEPTASLDPAVTRIIEALIRAVYDSGTAIVMATHDLGQARRIADEILFLHRGRLVEHRPAEALLDAPESAEARAFVAGELYW